MSCTLEDFTHFFNARAYDIIGEGSFRKHLNSCKEARDEWAVSMSSGLQKVVSTIKAIHSLVAKLEDSYPKLGKICRQVSLSAHPPVKLHAGSVQCALTQQQCTNSLSLPSGSKNAPVLVHVRFCRFFMFLWFICKIEYIVRCFVRSWMQSSIVEKKSYQKTAEEVSSLTPLITQLHSVFTKALDHVNSSIERLELCQKTSVIVTEKKNFKFSS